MSKLTTENSIVSLLEKLRSWPNDEKRTLAEGIKLFTELYENKDLNINSMVPILPFLLNLKGKPYSLARHPQMEVLYKIRDVPLRTLLMCGRQVSKSTNLAAQAVVHSAGVDYLNTLNIAPLFEQIRRFSNNYIRPFIEESPIRELLIGQKLKDNSVFQRSFQNGSNMFFTFAFLDAERVRGISADKLNLDEIQDIDYDFLPVIESCLDASELGMTLISGTPKTTDNTIHLFWEDSSQAHWVTKCTHCSDYNIAGLEFGLEKMVQKKGFCCKKCSELLNPVDGFFYHMYHDRINSAPGYHIPQVVLPQHYANTNKWFKLYNKKIKWPQYRYYNEVLGESCDVGSRLVTRTKLMQCAKLPWNLNLAEGIEAASNPNNEYAFITMGVDWGGGGGGQIKRKRNQLVVEGGTTSFTVVTIQGFRPGLVNPDVIYAERFATDMSPGDEAKRIMELFWAFRCNLVGHDFGGAGSIREALMLQAGLPQDRIMPCAYTHMPTKPIVEFKGADAVRPRNYYSVDKARSLALLCAVINADLARFPRWPVQEDVVLYEDFLALIEEKRESPSRSDTYLITKNPKKADDFCHAVNFGCLAYWHSHQLYPNLASRFGIFMGNENETPDLNYTENDW